VSRERTDQIHITDHPRSIGTAQAWPLVLLSLLLLVGIPFAVGAVDDLYFEEPRFIQAEGASYPEAHSVGERMVVLYQEVERTERRRGQIVLSAAVSEDGRSFEVTQDIAGPVSFSGTVPHVFSSTTRGDELWLVVGIDERTHVIYRSEDGGESFDEVTELSTVATAVAPTLSVSADGSLLLFINQDLEARQEIYVARSEDGAEWTDFERIVGEGDVTLSFAPAHAAEEDRDYLLFQGMDRGIGQGYQLYASVSLDGGNAWSEGRRITDFSDPRQPRDPASYDNQRPFVGVFDDETYVAWERRPLDGPMHVYLSKLSLQLDVLQDGEIDSDSDIRTAPRLNEIEQITSGRQPRIRPELIEHEEQLYLLWYEDPHDSPQIAIADARQGEQGARILSDMPGSSFNASFVSHRGRMHGFWQNRRDDQDGVAYLEPDQSVEPPRLIGDNFVPGERSRVLEPIVSVSPPDDPSGIQGYSYLWSQDPEDEPPAELRVDGESPRLSFEADEDGPWYLHVRARDRAGNWSDPERIEFVRDRTPPDPVEFVDPGMDDDGFLPSNTFTVEWEEPDDDYLAGYAYTLSRLGSIEQTVAKDDPRIPDPPGRVITSEPRISRQNIDNGIWVLRVSPVDDLGNVGEPQTLVFGLDQYVPVTYVTFVNTHRDRLNRITLDITGRGFVEEGEIERVFLDRDGQEPYDYVFEAADDAFGVIDDRRLQGPTLEAIRSGEYRVGLEHPERGLYFTDTRLSIEPMGRVTFGDFTADRGTTAKMMDSALFAWSAPTITMWAGVALLGLLAIGSITRLGVTVTEGKALKAQAHALVTGERMTPKERARRMKHMRRTTLGLRLKFTAFFVILVVAVVSMVSLPLGNFILNTQQRTLTEALRERSEVLLESIVSGAAQFMPTAEENLFELNALTLQTDAMQEALHATITGFDPGREEPEEVVWASNDPVIRRAAQFPADERVTDTDTLVRGQTRIQDHISAVVPQMVERINRQARNALGDIPERIDALNRERIEIAMETPDDAEERLVELDDQIAALETEQQEILGEIRAEVYSEPEFSLEHVVEGDVRRFNFYKPIVYRPMDEDEYVHGVVRLGMSTDRILAELSAARTNLLMTVGAITVVAVVIGIAGALILASIIVIPINRLVRGVEVIKETEDKAQLEGHVIDVRSRDELSTLADTINDMTLGLVQAAIANKDLIVGKEVQKMFIPLITDQRGNKLTTARDTFNGFDFFGYYEGAKGVSGDYFNYKQLDERHVAVIKCDVAGKGVPAALIMVEVATIYLSFFRHWKPGLQKELPALMTDVNDLLEERGFQGRFAAFTVGILDTHTGAFEVANAGDNQLHMYNAQDGKTVCRNLAGTPAAGVFSSDFIPTGFPRETVQLHAGDMLLLFTDGLEEAKRKLRVEGHRPFQPEPASGHHGAESGGPRGSSAPPAESGEASPTPDRDSGARAAETEAAESGELDEELGLERIYRIVDAVLEGQSYQLVRRSDPDGVDLVFDFSDLPPSPESVVSALMAVEKVFRLYVPEDAGPDDRVHVDRTVDHFLQRHFLAYGTYFGNPVGEASDGAYRTFAFVREDEQYDDLTILAIQRGVTSRR